MARQEMVDPIDDLDGSEAAKKVRFNLDGVGCKIDLSDDKARSLRDVLATNIEAAGGSRMGGRKATSRSRSRAAARAASPKAVRQWARENGHHVPARGRSPNEIAVALEAAS